MGHSEYQHIGPTAILLIEECSELIKALCKAERFGLENWNPFGSEGLTNRTSILIEMDDVERLIKELRLQLQ